MKKPRENLKRLLMKLKTYNLNPEDYIVYGSAPLAVAGYIDDVNDLDVVILPKAWPFGNRGKYDDGEIEFFMDWKNGDGTMSNAEDLILFDRMSEPYEGHYFVKPIKVLEYKKNMMRSKDEGVWKRLYK
jgi:hypothetical protein